MQRLDDAALRPASIGAGDVVIMNDQLQRIAETVRLSRRTQAVLWQNLTLALGIKAVFFVLAPSGSATMWMAVFSDMGASLLVVANGLRLLRSKAETIFSVPKMLLAHTARAQAAIQNIANHRS